MLKDGLNFGYFYCHGNRIADPEFGQENSCKEFQFFVVELNCMLLLVCCVVCGGQCCV